MARPRTRTKREDRDRRPKKKVSILDQESIEWIDYKDVNLLRRFMSERAKIRARRVTGNDAQQQRAVARAIRVAREMALLPYSVRQVTHRSKGKRGDRDGGTLREFRDQPRSGNGMDAPPDSVPEPATAELDLDLDAGVAATAPDETRTVDVDDAVNVEADAPAEDAS
jgi:small subunit ribosomal protein S18